MSKAAYVSEASSNDEAVLHNEDASHIKVALLKGEPKKNLTKLPQQFLLNFSGQKHDRQLEHNSFEK